MSVQPLPFRLGQRPCLDGLRGLAVAAVVAAHLGAVAGGVIGVDMLFALSGFLITVLLVEERERKGAISLRGFYRKRFLRVLPPLVLVLVAAGAGAVALGLGTPASVGREVAVALAFLSNWQGPLGAAMPTFGHTWTLALEVQFYLLWPVALTVLLWAGVRKGYVLALTGGAAVLSAAWRTGLFLQPDSPGQRRAILMRLFMGLDTHADSLLLGCVAGLVVAWGVLPNTDRARRNVRRAGYVSLAGLAYLLLRCHQEQFVYYYGLSFVIAAMCAALLVWWVTVPPRLLWLFESRPLVGLGRISYSVYLFHMPLIAFCRPLRQTWGAPATAALIVSATLVLAVLTYYLLERPVLSLRHRGPRAEPAAPPAPPAPAKAA